jgi:hypothetical protein
MEFSLKLPKAKKHADKVVQDAGLTPLERQHGSNDKKGAIRRPSSRQMAPMAAR